MFKPRNNCPLKWTIVMVILIFQVNHIVSLYHIFDITQLVNSNTENNSSIKFKKLLDGLNTSEFQFYYKTDESSLELIGNQLNDVIAFLDRQAPSYSYSSKGANFILDLRFSLFNDDFSSKDLKRKLAPWLDRISNVSFYLQRGLHYTATVQLPRYFRDMKEPNSSFNLGLRYTFNRDEFVDSFNVEEAISQVQFLVLTIDIPQTEFIPSYDLFKSYWKKLAQENSEFVGPQAVPIIYKIQLTHAKSVSSVEGKKLLLRYRQFIASCSAQLATEEKQTFIIELVSTKNDKLRFTTGGQLNQSDFVIFYSPLQEKAPGVIMHYLEKGQGQFNSLHLREDIWQRLLYCLKINITITDPDVTIDCHFRHKLRNKLKEKDKLNVILEIYPNLNSTKKAYPSYPTDFARIQTFGGNMIFYEPIYPTSSLQELKSLESGKTFLCRRLSSDLILHDENFLEYGTKAEWKFNSTKTDSEKCKAWFNITDIIKWNMLLALKPLEERRFDYEIVSKVVFKRLELVNNERVKFIEKNPGKEIILDFNIHLSSKSVMEVSMYCDVAKERRNQFLESLVNWAALRNVRITLGSLIEEGRRPGWINIASLPDGLVDHYETILPLLRNYPSSVNWLGKLDPCIEKTIQIPEGGIILYQNLSGVVLNLDSVKSTSLSVNELKTMIHFVMHKFSRVIIQVGGDADVRKLKIAFSQTLEEIGKSKEGYFKLLEIYLEIPFPPENSTSMQFDKGFEDLINVLKEYWSVPLIGIHATVPENGVRIEQAVKELETGLEQFVKSGVNAGVAFDSCISALNSYLQDPESRKELPVQLKYVVCKEKDIAVGSSLSKMTKLLDGQLVIANAFKSYFPHLEQIHFQLSPKQTAPLDLLRFYGDVNKFSEGYKLSYFIGPAFDDYKKESSGWWRLENYEDLSKASLYIDKEAELLGKSNWRPQHLETNYVTIALWTTLAVVTCLLVVACGIVFYLWKRSKILTEKEIREFFYGKKMTRNGMELSPQDDFSVRGFNAEYEIPKVHHVLDSCPILGMGNFGTVVKTTVRDEMVALKIPNDSCSKDSFKSMLVEVKLLCYIGKHVNVIKFVGAYVKEISKGVIQIATVLCENGSLQSFLRAKQLGILNEESEQEVESGLVRELIQFSKEIASGMAYIGSKNVVHADLSTRNVLLDENFTCKIADFGLARKMYEYNKYVKQSQEPLPWRWMACESLEKMEFSIKSDVWSYGITLWEIFSLGAVPYPGLNWSVDFVEKLCAGLRMTRPRFSTLEIYTQMSNCWNIEPETRPTFENMNDFFNGLTKSDYHILHEI